MTDDVRRLLGGYATGTLTEAERKALYEAALDDDKLFDALANDHALKELLDDPAARAQALQATETHSFSVWATLNEWLDRPRSKALVATGAVLVVAIAIGTYRDQQKLHVAKIAEPPQLSNVPSIAPASPEKREARPSSVNEPPASKRSAAPRVRARDDSNVVQLADEARREAAPVAESQPQPVLTAAAPPAPPAASTAIARFVEEKPSSDALARSAASGATQLKYVLMKRSASGGYLAVPFDAEFSSTDEAQVVVESNEAGTVVLVADDATRLPALFVEPGKPATFPLPAGARSARLLFSHTAPRAVGSTLIPAGARSVKAETDLQKQIAPQLSLEIKINRK